MPVTRTNNLSIGRGDWPRRLIQVGVFLIVLAVVPPWWCGRDAAGWFDGDLESQAPLAEQARTYALERVDTDRNSTGSALFDGEWAFVSCQMTVLGLGQVITAHPSSKAVFLPAMEACLDAMIAPDAVAFGAAQWGESGDASAVGAHAYLGYLNMALSMHRKIVPDSRFAPLNDLLTTRFVEQLEAKPFYTFETYPGQVFPPDMSTVIGSIGLYDDATGTDHGALLERWFADFRRYAVDPDTGLVNQRLSKVDGIAVDGPRGSGTAFCVYFLSFANMEFSKELYDAQREQLHGHVLGFGTVDEYPDGVAGGGGDIDSGPVIFGIGTSATGFALAGARIHNDAPFFERLYRTAHVFGAPQNSGDTVSFLMGGPIGDALMLAMLTAGARNEQEGPTDEQ